MESQSESLQQFATPKTRQYNIASNEAERAYWQAAMRGDFQALTAAMQRLASEEQAATLLREAA